MCFVNFRHFIFKNVLNRIWARWITTFTDFKGRHVLIYDPSVRRRRTWRAPLIVTQLCSAARWRQLMNINGNVRLPNQSRHGLLSRILPFQTRSNGKRNSNGVEPNSAQTRTAKTVKNTEISQSDEEIIPKAKGRHCRGRGFERKNGAHPFRTNRNRTKTASSRKSDWETTSLAHSLDANRRPRLHPSALAWHRWANANRAPPKADHWEKTGEEKGNSKLWKRLDGFF